MKDLLWISVSLILFIIFSSGCILDKIPHSFTSYFTYELIIQSSDRINNVTFYTPLPVKNNSPTIGMMVLTKNDFEKNNFSADLIQLPQDLKPAGAFPFQNNNQWYLKINADQINPNKTQTDVYNVFIDNLTSPFSPQLFADTVYPITNESVFLPKIDFSPSIPIMINQTSSHWIRYTPVDITQKIPVYAYYSASPTTRVEIFSSIHGSNSWRYSDDSGGGNDYWDYYKWYNIGESHGWQIADGRYKSAQGVYPNLDHPEWQDVLNETLNPEGMLVTNNDKH